MLPELLDHTILGLRLTLLVACIMGVIRLTPYLIATPKTLRTHGGSSGQSNECIWRGMWALICWSGVMFSVEFFERVYFMVVPDQAAKILYLIGLVAFTWAILGVLINAAIEDRRSRFKVRKGVLIGAYALLMLGTSLVGMIAVRV